MAPRACPSLTTLALLTVAAWLPAQDGLRPAQPFTLQAIRAQEAFRAERIQEALSAQNAHLSTGALAPTSRFTDSFGETHVHFSQTYKGVKVWNSHLVGHMSAEGEVLPAHATVMNGIELPDVELLDRARIEALVRRQLPAEGRLWPIQIEKVVFPTQFQDGIKVVRTSRNGFELDRRFSVATPRRKEAFVWAYHVSTLQSTREGMQGTEFILDGRNGDVLKKWDGMVYADAPSAAVASGKSQYNGTVVLNTTNLGNGNYTLRDTTRATKVWPKLSAHPTWTECAGIGIQTMYYDDNATTVSGLMPFLNTTNAWGDGKKFMGTLGNTNSETAAVDAHYAIQATWDYYQNVLGRTGGIDGQGGSPISFVHFTSYGMPWANAAWNPSFFVMMYGDGSETGALTSLDVAAHEMSHGVFSYSANLASAEGSGINEANSDVHATMMKFYQWGAGGTGSVIPETVTASPDGNNDTLHAWTTGSQLSATKEPMRFLYKPSLDGISHDAWFDGLGLEESHFSMGPGNRAFYFLAQGASSDATKATYSPYLPGGMTGIGNDKAIKVWYRTMATKVTNSQAGFQAIRPLMIEAAQELYGASAASAVKNAFAAINVGAPEGGQEPAKVMLPVDPDAVEMFGDGHFIVAPAMVPVPLPKPTVTNLTDTSTTWSLGGLSMLYPQGGKIVDGTSFLAPMYTANYYGNWPVKVWSKADPKRFAVGMMFSVTLDCDADTDTDACDLGAIALSYGLTSAPYPAANVYGSYYGVDDICCALFLMGFNNAYKH